jgi:hypothetical protein
MADLALKNELNEALQLDVYGNPTNDSQPSSACAEWFYNSHPQLIEKLKRPWMIERLTNMIKNARRQGWPLLEMEKQQLNLPGFEDLPRRIFLRNGARKLLDKATIGDVRQHLKMLRDRFKNHPKIKQMEAVLDLMHKYNAEKQRITWKQVKQRELELLRH